jgi:hypothetical protein
VADNVAGPVDLINAGLGLFGLRSKEPVGGSEWMKRWGLKRDVEMGGARLAGETAGLLSPALLAAKAPQIAKGLLQAQENAAIPRQMHPEMGAIVYHGSPHKFDKFDSSKIGTGEGAQAYGHGLYFAQNPEIAGFYQKALSTGARGSDAPKFKAIGGELKGVSADTAHDIAQGGMPALEKRIAEVSEVLGNKANYAFEVKHSGQAAADENLGYWKRELDSLQQLKATGDLSLIEGNLYKVDLPDEAIAKMLDWDKPLSQQAPEVRAAAEQFLNGPMTQLPTGYKVEPKFVGGREGFAPMAPGGVPMTSSVFKTQDEATKYALDMLNEFRLKPDTKGAHIYSMFDRNQTSAADMMQRAGIPGIRYLDGGSRGAGSGTSNYVVFPGEEHLLKILERNGGLMGP